jgi:hypothetical protein
VEFIDTGLNARKGQALQRVSLGRTDEQGRLKRLFVYDWGYSYTGDGAPTAADGPARSFALAVVADGFTGAERTFHLRDLERPPGGGAADKAVNWRVTVTRK